MMTILAPEWFFLTPLLIVLGWKFKFLRMYEPLRLILITLLVLALSQPVLKLGDGDMDLWLLVDQSDSAMGKPDNATREILSILEKSKRQGDNVHIVDFAKSAVLREKGDPVFRGGTNSTRLGHAVDYILTKANASIANRLLILSDGYPTDSLDRTAEKLLSQGIAADSRTFSSLLETDYRIADIQSPSRVRPGEAFILEFSILSTGSADAPVNWEIEREGSPPLKGSANLENGKGSVRITDRLSSPRAASYNLRIIPAKPDPVPQNNSARVWIEATGGSAALLITRYANDPIASFLRAQNIQTGIITKPETLSPAHFTGTRLIIINDVPAASIPVEFLNGLNFFVNEQGGGLLMCGGRNSFGAGGYFSSAIDPIMPVSMELKNEQRKFTVCMSFVLDRSGSMSVSTASGKTKMDLANAGSVNAIQLLSDEDFISVHAVDSTPHTIVPMTQIGDNRVKICNAVSRIQSDGGGIFVKNGIMSGFRELKKTKAGTRHLILFSDAADSEEPGDYKKYLADMRKEGVTLSVIALGTRQDVDADLLDDIARLGGGRLFFSEDGSDLPSIFAQETVSVARSAFIAEPTPLIPTQGWFQIASKPIQWPSEVEAYNLSYLKEGATAACLSGDEYKAPLVAFWQRGQGRTGAISFPMAGEDASKLLAWKDYGNYVQTFCRWLAGDGTPEGFTLKTALKGEQLELELLYSDRNIPVVARHAPESSIEIVSTDGRGTVKKGIWEHIEPGKFNSSFLLDHGQYLRGSVKMGDKTIPFGPIALFTNPEWNMSAAQKEEFKKLVSVTGGRERQNLDEIWKEPRPVSQRHALPYLVWTSLVLLIADALLTRLGISLLPARWRKSASTATESR